MSLLPATFKHRLQVGRRWCLGKIFVQHTSMVTTEVNKAHFFVKLVDTSIICLTSSASFNLSQQYAPRSFSQYTAFSIYSSLNILRSQYTAI
jgi:hypothetical protein